MITKITTENQTQIQEAIHANGEGAITGDILQEKMLLLNRDSGRGELEFYDTEQEQVLGMAELNLMLPPGMGRLMGPWRTFMNEYYNSDYPSGVYTKVYDGAISNRFMGYIFLRYETATTIVVTFWLNLYSDLYSFEVTADNWTISNVKRLNFI